MVTLGWEGDLSDLDKDNMKSRFLRVPFAVFFFFLLIWVTITWDSFCDKALNKTKQKKFTFLSLTPHQNIV